MLTMKTVTLGSDGRLTLPIESRRALGILGEAELEVEVDVERDALVLRPVLALRREDAWAYTPDHRALLERAHEDSREGRVRDLDEDDLAALAR
jgi:bifunctional DNA-binding transcriptional regulator/antitoxin component of YhaV-PrlF toxin-antitoxin module